MMKRLLTLALCGIVFLGGCGRKKDSGKLLIGFSIADLKEERWQRDREMFEEEANKLGAEVIVQDASGDPNTQIQQCENMLVRGAKVLVVVPKNADAAAPIVEKAHRKGCKVLCYDRVISNAEPDLYVSFDNVRVGEIQAQEIIKLVPEGKYLQLKGDPGDKNALMVAEGHDNVLQPAIDDGKIEIVLSQFCDKWLGSEAKRITEDALTRYEIDAIVASNDGTAAGAIAALEAKGLAGKIPISGQDADLLNCQYIVQGKQAVSVYKPIKELAIFCAKAAVALAKDEEIEGVNSKVNNGLIEVPTVFLDPVPVTKDNIDQTVIADGFHSRDKLYSDK
ncbi:MAG TPA: substrate-binding domain-containing protein [Mariniphaga sp.]|nr:substrate-binding domain-containing protein [Mariniphaga sp.]